MANEVLPEHVRDVRDKTSAPLLDCKKALQESKGDIERAIEILKIKGLSKVEKKRVRKRRGATSTNEGNEKNIS